MPESFCNAICPLCHKQNSKHTLDVKEDFWCSSAREFQYHCPNCQYSFEYNNDGTWNGSTI